MQKAIRNTVLDQQYGSSTTVHTEKTMADQKKEILDAVLLGSIEWEQARLAALTMSTQLKGEIDALTDLSQIKDAYSPTAWVNICRQMKVVTDGMTSMRLLLEGKSSAEISRETGINGGSFAAYKAWNTMYKRDIQEGVRKIIQLKGRNKAEQEADAAFLRSCG